MLLVNIFLIVVLCICVITDLKSRKIYNKVIFPSLLLALITNSFFYGWSGISATATGFFLGLAILFIPFLLGGMGAGDVKLLAFIGALKGTSFVFTTAIYMALVGAVIALGIIIFRKGLIKKFFYYVYGKKSGLQVSHLLDRKVLTATYPYGVAIALGAVCALVFQELPQL